MAERWYGQPYRGRNDDSGGGEMYRRRSYREPNRGPSVTTILTAVNVAFFVAQQIFPGFTYWGIKDAGRIMYRGEYYRLGSAMFLHGDVMHLLFNTLSLRSLGAATEGIFGKSKMISIYLVAGVAGNLASLYMTPNPALGASGAIFGLGGALAAFLMSNKQRLSGQGDAMLRSLGQSFAINMMYGLTSRRIDNAGHIGGLIGGAIMGYMIGPNLRPNPRPIRPKY